MVGQAVAENAKTFLGAELKEEAWEERPVPFLLEIAPDGAFLNVVERMKSVPRGKKMISMPETLSVPRSPVTRKSGLSPLLGVDDIRYVLGVGAWTAEKDRDNHAKRHDAFIKLVRQAAQETRDPALEACESFYAKPAEVAKARNAMKAVKTGTLVALSVGGPMVFHPSVQAYWRQHYRRTFGERVSRRGGFADSLVSRELWTTAP